MKINQRFCHLNPTAGTEKHGPVLIAKIITGSKKPPFRKYNLPAHRPHEGVPLSPEETASPRAFLLALSALATEAFELEGFLPLLQPRPPPLPPSLEVPTSSCLALPLYFFDDTSEPTLHGGVILGTAPAGTG